MIEIKRTEYAVEVYNKYHNFQEQIDVFSTWYSSFNVGQAFIEREHVSNDAIGANLVPENLETGEYIAQNLAPATDYNQLCVIVASMLDLEEYISCAQLIDFCYKQYCLLLTL
mgnify:CR=1 FL=1